MLVLTRLSGVFLGPIIFHIYIMSYLYPVMLYVTPVDRPHWIFRGRVVSAAYTQGFTVLRAGLFGVSCSDMHVCVSVSRWVCVRACANIVCTYRYIFLFRDEV